MAQMAPMMQAFIPLLASVFIRVHPWLN